MKNTLLLIFLFEQLKPYNMTQCHLLEKINLLAHVNFGYAPYKINKLQVYKRDNITDGLVTFVSRER